MFADLLLPPTGFVDWYMVGPASIIVFLAVSASLIALFILLVRKRIHKGWSALVCLVLFVACDLIVYAIGYNIPTLSRGERDRRGPQPKFEQQQELPTRPSE
jgi:hypothetical protein